ncbi:putative O-methyltransferase YrrM [Mycolicibacterium sp. BK556]|uniref:O-methyltransferase n=1 Tax=unclassified Mycolicibacterium TaxID=2636767 RepID=UPI0017F7DB94|nr:MULTISPECIES: class I SAM-dependent methyltransferase [unclassified Mycolicibacterium]MBB3602168.1 putative O-methyltransferase YrrM [Mycolicibacterium sp. BK556]MBB3631920.1 putative O-methyltransferase YrrM [Mycolicibacterium sp. BK607]MBB3749939.1 putative O-methyltransferase YrrM [Mycolicibacterium sp. BK634]
MNTLREEKVAAVIDRMYAEASDQMSKFRERGAEIQAAKTAQERADAFREFYLPVTPESGQLLYTLVRATRPALVVEFGMSLGLSAIHLASAVRDNGVGRVVTTELSADKVVAAKASFAEVGLDDLITVLEGDATETLAAIDEPVDFVLLDGWKDLYVPVIELLGPKLSPGALVIADNTGLADAAPYVDYIRDPANGYVGVSFPVRNSDAMEISCRT